jgi:hypothetical protein
MMSGMQSETRKGSLRMQRSVFAFRKGEVMTYLHKVKYTLSYMPSKHCA